MRVGDNFIPSPNRSREGSCLPLPSTRHHPRLCSRNLLLTALAAVFTVWLASAARSAEEAHRAPPQAAQIPAERAPRARPPADVRIDVPLVLDRRILAELPAVISAREELVALDGVQLLRAIAPYVSPAKLTALRARIDRAGRLLPDAIHAEGLGVVYDPARVEVRLDVPLEMRPTRSVSLTGVGREGPETRASADVSSYVNVLAGLDIQNGASGGRQPLVVDLDGAFNVLGNVVEGLGTYRDDGRTRWERGDVRFVRDEEELRTRFSFGDLSYRTDGFQSSQRTAGLAIQRNFGLQPYRSSAPVGQSQLNLDRNARVDVLVNGQRMRTLDLGPGRYNVRDFPFVGGTNDVVLRITDEVGRVETIRFPFVFDTTLLGEGEHDFGLALGVPSETTRSGRTYNDADRVYSLFHAYGLTDQLTLGANLQGSDDVRQYGVESRWATIIGTFRADAALSDSVISGGGGALRLQHRYVETPSPQSVGQNLASSATFRSQSFSALGETTASNSTALDLAVLYGQRLYEQLYGSIGLGRQIARNGAAHVSTGDINFSLPIADDVTAYLLLSTRQPSDGEKDHRIFLSVSWFPLGSGQRFGASYDYNRGEGATRRADWSYTPSTRVDAVRADLSVDREHTTDSLQGEVGYTGYRFTSSVYRSTETSRKREEGGRSHRTSFNFGTALAFADGHFAVTRPISDSFVIIAPHPTIADQTIEANVVSDTPEARSDIFGPPVLPEVNSYYQRHIVVDAPDLPLGYDLGQQVHDVRPTYRRGVIVPVGTGATVLGDGVLIDAEGKPLPLERGTIVALDDSSLPAVEFFTNRSGRFRVEGLAPGRFRLELANEPEAAIVFAIPAGTFGRYDLGRLTYPITP